MKSKSVNYKKIYEDILNEKFPDKILECMSILNKKNLTVLDVIELNKKIFGKENLVSESQNKRFRSYNKSDILMILDYQKKYNLNNTQMAIQFGLSRTTIAYWKKLFL